jgi:hypothetical protein
MSPVSTTFELSGVVHLVRPAGAEVHDLEALRLALDDVPDRSLFHHTSGRLLRHPHVDEPPPDDVSGWVNGVVQDRETAERLSYAVDVAGLSPAELRAALKQVLDGVPEKQRVAHDAPPGGDFVFLTAESVPVPEAVPVTNAAELFQHLAGADPSVWFYHLIEQPWFEAREATVFGWLGDQGETRVAEWLEDEAHAGRSLNELRSRVLKRWRLGRLGTRIAEAALSTENERREAGRAAVSNLFKRIRRPGEPEVEPS